MNEFEREYADLAASFRRASQSASSPDGRRRAQADYNEAVRDVAMRQQSMARERPQPVTQAKREPTLGESGRGYIRAAAQGATFGLGEEAEALARSLASGTPYSQGVQRIRGEMQQFREARPKSAMAAEVAGGLVTGGVGAVRSGVVGAGGSLLSRALSRAASAGGSLAKSSVGQGALSGAGSAEGGIPERLTGAGVGGLVGGTLAKAVGAAAGGAGRIASRISEGARAFPSAAVGAVSRLAEKAGIGDLQGAIQTAATQASPETRVMDVLGRPGARMASGLRLAGGKADETISNVLEERMATRPERLAQRLYTGRQSEDVTRTIDELIEGRREIADELYEAALGAKDASGLRQSQPISDKKIESYLRRPIFRKAVQLAKEDIRNAGGRIQYVDLGNGKRRAARTPEFLDNVKKALDDVIYRGRQPGEGGFGPGQLARAKQVRQEFVRQLDDAIPGYAEARAAWAGPTALKGALEDGLDAASSRVEANALRKQVSELPSSELEFFQRGYIDRLRQRIDDGQLKPAEIRSSGFEKRIRSVFGDDANRIIADLREETNLTETASRVLRGSPTAERLQDVAEVEGPMVSGRFIRAFGEPLRTAARVSEFLEGKLRGGLTEQRRQSVAEALMRPTTQAQPLLEAMAREQRARLLGRKIEQPTTRTLSRLFGSGTVENF